MKFLLLLGPTGIGKSSIIKELLAMSDKHVYISPHISRPLRDGETDKVHVPREEILANKDKYVSVQELYGNVYATPRQAIEDAFAAGKTPVLDFPVHKAHELEAHFPCTKVYVATRTLGELIDRLKERPERITAAVHELNAFKSGLFKGKYDAVVYNDSTPLQAATQLLACTK